MKNLLIIFASAVFLLLSCNKEPAIPPSAQFSLNLFDNTAYAGETFYLYLDNCDGDYYTLYPGLSDGTTYKPDTATKGTPIDINIDSIGVTYANGGEYNLSFVASSSGNWGEDFVVDVSTKIITVVDGRTGFISMEVNKRNGENAPGNEILFYAHKMEDLTNERVKFLTVSRDAEVYVNDVQQESGKNYHDFSALNPGDDEGRTITYTVKAINGETGDFAARFILRDASSEKILYRLSSTTLTAKLNIDEENKEVNVSYYEGESLYGKLLANASSGAVVEVGGEEIETKARNVDLETETVIKVVAEDLSEQEYAIVLFEKEWISAFNFTAFDPGTGSESLNPVILGDVTFDSRSINITVPANMELGKVIATFEGISDFTLKVDGTELTSGVTEYNYSSGSFDVEIFDGSTLIDKYALKVQ